MATPANQARIDIEIDKHRLDEEWLKQPRLVLQYNAKLSEAKAEVAYTANQVTITRAQIANDVRNHPENYGVLKLSNDVIENCVNVHEDVTAIEADLLLAKGNVGILEAACIALEHKKRALENLVRLQLADYYSEPNAEPGVARGRVEDAKRKKAMHGVAAGFEDENEDDT
jgi:hypothetical protein